MNRTLGALALVVPAAMLLGAAPAAAQDDLDRTLDESLRREFRATGGSTAVKLPRVEEPDPLIPEVKPKGELPKDEEKKPGEPCEADDEGVEGTPWRLRFKWSHWNLEVTDWKVGGKGLADPSRTDADGFALGLDAGEWLTFEAAFRYVVARGGEVARRDLDLRGHTFAKDAVIDTKFSFITTDLDVVFKPLHGRFGHLDVIGGVRYLGTWSRVTDLAGPGRSGQSIEALVPMIGVGGSLRMATEKNHLAFEPFARAIVGGMRYDRGRDRLRAFTLSVEAGARFLIADAIGIELGYRYELGSLDKGGNGPSSRSTHWRAGGMITGIVFQF